MVIHSINYLLLMLIIGVVYSGRKVNKSLFLSEKVYISFNTTSDSAPSGFENNSENSKIGVCNSLKL